jgi:hypothetical protein
MADYLLDPPDPPFDCDGDCPHYNDCGYVRSHTERHCPIYNGQERAAQEVEAALDAAERERDL